MDSAASGGWRAGIRAGVPLGLAASALAVTFGAYATLAGWPPAATILMSALVFSGSAQFAFITAVSGGAGLITGLGAGALMNLRFVPMAAAAARSLHGGRFRRALEGQAVVDGSWVLAQRPDGTTNREMMIGATLVQWPAWVLGTAVGRAAGPFGRPALPVRARRRLPRLLPLAVARGRSLPARPPLGRADRGGAGLGRRVDRAGRRRPAAVRGRQPVRAAPTG